MEKDELNIKDMFMLHNQTIWKIQRNGMVDFYWFSETNRYIFESWNGDWIGRKKYINNEFTQKRFETEHKAVKWLMGY
jgi:hypothetical protein